jgi:hypothetical protein
MVDSWVPRGMWWYEAYSRIFCVILLSRGRKYYRPLQSNVNTDWLFVPHCRNVNMVSTLRHQIGVLDFSFQFTSFLFVCMYLHFISASMTREWGRSGELRDIIELLSDLLSAFSTAVLTFVFCPLALSLRHYKVKNLNCCELNNANQI